MTLEPHNEPSTDKLNHTRRSADPSRRHNPGCAGGKLQGPPANPWTESRRPKTSRKMEPKNPRDHGTEPGEGSTPNPIRRRRDRKRTPYPVTLSHAQRVEKPRRSPTGPKAPKSTPPQEPHPEDPGPSRSPNPPPLKKKQEQPQKQERRRPTGQTQKLWRGPGSNATTATPEGNSLKTARVSTPTKPCPSARISTPTKPCPDPETTRRFGAGSMGEGTECTTEGEGLGGADGTRAEATPTPQVWVPITKMGQSRGIRGCK
ncbi:proteoglycan 4-like [Procambarus clarkii]|uniref:proteoglycan 4-like n=1 Tax=Procambarus clarkii TaxID=6728 RepID=UPI0037441079